MSPTPDWVKQLKPSGPQGHELLAAERAGSNISAEKLEELLHTKEDIEMTKRILSILKSDKAFDKSQNLFQGRIDRFAGALAREKRLRILKMQHNWSEDEFRAAFKLIGEQGPYGLHDSMFLVRFSTATSESTVLIKQVTLREQTTPEQQEKWLKPAEKYEIIGCYAQTELGHGSNVRGLETQAIWNPEDKTFTLHSPHLTASKWWIGSLGRTANHAVVMAQLIINGKSYGPTPFLVQIRDLKTHEPLENVHIGDIGPKFGFNTMDNGFLLFNNYKIPHISMLARYSHVDPATNKFERRGSPSCKSSQGCLRCCPLTLGSGLRYSDLGPFKYRQGCRCYSCTRCYHRNPLHCHSPAVSGPRCASWRRRNPCLELHYGADSTSSSLGCYICATFHGQLDDGVVQ